MRAHNGLQAVAFATKINFDAIIMDWELPVMNGDEVTKLILEKIPDSTIIILSAHR